MRSVQYRLAGKPAPVAIAYVGPQESGLRLAGNIAGSAQKSRVPVGIQTFLTHKLQPDLNRFSELPRVQSARHRLS
jgi:hypothetical protein